MKIDQLVEQLQKEKQEQVASRYPCRAIMVNTVDQYCELLKKLKTISGITVFRSDDLFDAADLMPNYEKLCENKYANQWIILPGVSEYLRLFHKSEQASARFAKLWHHQNYGENTGRILIPLWGCVTEWFNPALNLQNDIRQDEFYYDCTDAGGQQILDITVLSSDFDEYASQMSSVGSQMCVTMQEWYEYWANPVAPYDRQILLTGRHRNVIANSGNVSIHVIRDVLSFVQENLGGGKKLTAANCPEEAQQLLFQYALSGTMVENAVLSSLNVLGFSGIDVMGKWKTMSEGQKQLVRLWYDLHPDSSYLCNCVKESTDEADLLQRILMDIFRLRIGHPEWIEESQKLSRILNLPKKEAFFEELDKMPVYEDRLVYLTNGSRSERIYLLHMVGKWMREDASQVFECEALKEIFPELYAYLSPAVYDEDLRRYFSLYKAYKLENTLPVDEETYFAGIRPEEYDYRFAVMSPAITDDTVVLWIDALGAEWLPLLKWALEQQPGIAVNKTAIAQATLPTETCFNEQWNQMTQPYEKLDKLDKLAHKGVIDEPDYYACIEDQITFISKAAEKAAAMTGNYHRVIITGDHGTSRLAARFFHKSDGMPVPPGAEPCSHGRYCKLAGNSTVEYFNTLPASDMDGNLYRVFKNYDHFKKSGFAAGADDEEAIYGEVHGGATPEEVLVPIVVIDSIYEAKQSAEWKNAQVKIMRKKATAELVFAQPVGELQVKAGSINGAVSQNGDNKHWKVVFENIAPEAYAVSVAADGKLVEVGPLTILSALGGGLGDL